MPTASARFLTAILSCAPGQRNAVKFSRARYAQLRAADPAGCCPDWLSDAVRKSWGIDISDRPEGIRRAGLAG